MILPIFAFANAGISFAEITYADLTSSLTLGIFAALFFGNQIGVFGVTMLAVKLKLAQLPHNVSLKEFYGVCMICGVGFTMSLFVGSLAFNDLHEGFKLLNQVKLGVILGSATSGLLGYLFLRWATKNRV